VQNVRQASWLLSASLPGSAALLVVHRRGGALPKDKQPEVVSNSSRRPQKPTLAALVPFGTQGEPDTLVNALHDGKKTHVFFKRIRRGTERETNIGALPR
jgi:hypothetical protein